MKRLFLTAPLLLFFTISLVAQESSKLTESSDSKLVYADFQNNDNGRPVSKRGGQTRLNRYAQNNANPPQFRGMENSDPPAPALARVTDEDRAAAFDYEMRIPNEWRELVSKCLAAGERRETRCRRCQRLQIHHLPTVREGTSNDPR
jgi:hypothetical protein